MVNNETSQLLVTALMLMVQVLLVLLCKTRLSCADCSGNKPLEGPLKQDLEQALALAERFTKEYDNLLRHFEEEMFNTSKLLDMLRKQFSWVSSLANHTTSDDGIFKIQTVSPDLDTLILVCIQTTISDPYCM